MDDAVKLGAKAIGSLPYPLNEYSIAKEVLDAVGFTTIQDREATLIRVVDDVQQAEFEYRLMHDRHGDGSQAAGRAWDLMRRAGDKAREALGTSGLVEKGSKDG